MIPTDTFQYLKEHLGCMYSIAWDTKHQRLWRMGEPLKEADLINPNINCCQELPNEITLESDYEDKEVYKNKENQDYAEVKLKEAGAGYYISSHKGKSDYIRFRFTTAKTITPKLRLAIIRHLAKPGLKFDENFFSLNFVRPVPGRFHWKHSYEKEQVIKVVHGEDLNIDKLGIIELPKSTKIHSGSLPYTNYEPRGWACSISIIRMAKRHNIESCPNCKTKFNFTDKLGWFTCLCQKGDLKQFAQIISQNHNPAESGENFSFATPGSVGSNKEAIA